MGRECHDVTSRLSYFDRQVTCPHNFCQDCSLKDGISLHTIPYFNDERPEAKDGENYGLILSLPNACLRHQKHHQSVRHISNQKIMTSRQIDNWIQILIQYSTFHKNDQWNLNDNVNNYLIQCL